MEFNFSFYIDDPSLSSSVFLSCHMNAMWQPRWIHTLTHTHTQIYYISSLQLQLPKNEKKKSSISNPLPGPTFLRLFSALLILLSNIYFLFVHLLKSDILDDCNYLSYSLSFPGSVALCVLVSALGVAFNDFSLLFSYLSAFSSFSPFIFLIRMSSGATFLLYFRSHSSFFSHTHTFAKLNCHASHIKISIIVIIIISLKEKKNPWIAYEKWPKTREWINIYICISIYLLASQRIKFRINCQIMFILTPLRLRVHSICLLATAVNSCFFSFFFFIRARYNPNTKFCCDVFSSMLIWLWIVRFPSRFGDDDEC